MVNPRRRRRHNPRTRRAASRILYRRSNPRRRHRRHNPPRFGLARRLFGRRPRFGRRAIGFSRRPRLPRFARRFALARRGNPRRHLRRRHNPGIGSMVSGVTGSLASMLNKIPVVGGFLASMVSFVPASLFGAIGVEPTMMAVKYLGPYVPMLDSKLFFVASSWLVAAAVAKFLPIDPATKKQLATAIASAGAGIAYYQWRTGTDKTVAAEKAGLDGYGDMQYAVTPYGDASPADASYCPFDLDGTELGAARMGPAAWSRRFPVRGRPQQGQRQDQPSRHAGKKGHRWGWLIQLMGPERFQQFSQLSEAQRVAFIDQLKRQVQGMQFGAPALAADTDGDVAGYGAVVYAGANVI